MRFRPEQHLRRQSEFRAIRERGRRVNCGAFTLWFFSREQPAIAPDTVPGAPVAARHAAMPETRRLGVVASTAAVGHAVWRNRAKRRLREVFRRYQELIPPGCDILLSARAAAVHVPMNELEQKFLEGCRKAAPSKNA